MNDDVPLVPMSNAAMRLEPLEEGIGAQAEGQRGRHGRKIGVGETRVAERAGSDRRRNPGGWSRCRGGTRRRADHREHALDAEADQELIDAVDGEAEALDARDLGPRTSLTARLRSSTPSIIVAELSNM